MDEEIKKDHGAEDKQQPGKNKEEADNQEKKVSDKMLLIGALVIILLFAVVFGLSSLIKSQPKTIEDLHLLNIEGKLDPEIGYMYKGVYSFVSVDGVWYTQLKSPTGKRLYDLAFRYSPADLEEVKINGWLNTTLFNEEKSIYVTFNPLGSDFPHIALAVGDFDTHMIKAFEKEIIAACDTNETEECRIRPVINCDNTDKPVLYVKEDNESGVIYNNNCIIVKGIGFDLVKGVDRVLYQFYGIMD